MITARPTSAETAGVRYQTIEQRRAALHNALLKHPADTRLRDHLVQLTTPRLIRQAAKDGIFLSYARADELFAVDLATSTRKSGVHLWLDMFDVPTGADWHKEVRAALKRCGLMLAIVSPEASEDEQLAVERRTFMKQGKIVLPVVYERDVRSLELYLPPVDFRFSFKLGRQTLMRLIAPIPETSGLSNGARRTTQLLAAVGGSDAQH